MSSDNQSGDSGPAGETPARHRRSSITQAAMSNLFGRGSVGSNNGFPGGNGPIHDPQRRRLSVTTLGLSGTSPTNNPAFGMRRGSISTSSDSIDENAVEDDESGPGSARTAPTTPFVRRMSFGGPTMRNVRPGGSPGNGNDPTSPPLPGRRHSGQKTGSAQGSSISAALSAAGRRSSTVLPASSIPQASNTKSQRTPSDNAQPRPDQQGFNWSEQLRSRAESSVATGPRPSFSLASSSPPRGPSHHDRAKSVSDMPQPPAQAAAAKPKPEPRPKPDAFQERILKGDFYMD